MSGTLIIAPLPIASVAASSGDASWLLTPSPRETCVAADAAPATFVIDMGAAAAIDSLFLGYTNAVAAASWSIATAAAAGGPWTEVMAAQPFRAADSLGPHHGFARLAAPVTARFWRMIVSPNGGPALEAGILILGLADEKYRELGGGRTPVDTGSRTDLASGGFGAGGGVVKAAFAWSYSDLTDVERNRLWAIAFDRGIRRPVLVVEDADLTIGRNEAIHYGVFDRFQPYERRETNMTRWAFSVAEWR